MFTMNGVSNDTIRLQLFLFSLRGAAYKWLTPLPRGSIKIWGDMVGKHLGRYFPPSKSANSKLMRDSRTSWGGALLMVSLHRCVFRFTTTCSDPSAYWCNNGWFFEHQVTWWGRTIIWRHSTEWVSLGTKDKGTLSCWNSWNRCNHRLRSEGECIDKEVWSPHGLESKFKLRSGHLMWDMCRRV